MATILDFLRDLLTEEDEQRAFLNAPDDYLKGHDFADLSGEDVAEAIAMLRRSLPPDLAQRLVAYEGGGDGLTPVRPQAGESEHDAAIRQLTHATMLARAGEPLPEPAAAPEAEEPEAPAPEVAEEPAEPTIEPEETEPAVATTTSSKPRAESGTQLDSSGRIDPFVTFGDELADIVRYATERMEDLLHQAQDHHDQALAQADRDADAIRVKADGEAEQTRKAAEADAAQVRKAATDEAHATRSAAETDAAAIRQKAHEESDAVVQAAKAAAEDLRQRLQGVESAFRTLQEGSADRG